MKPVLVILAAGASTRLATCKALVDLEGRSVLERLLAAGAVLDGAPPLVVTGADHGAIAAAAPAGCELLENPAWEAGRTGGVALAHRARPGRALCLAPVDVPLVPPGVFAALSQAWDEAGSPDRGWLAPCLALPGHPGDGRHGHPMVLGPALAGLLGPDWAGRPLRELRPEADPLLDLDVPDPEILDDLDTPEDLGRLRIGLRRH